MPPKDSKVATAPHMRYVSCPDDAWSDVETYVTPSNVSSTGADENKDDNFQDRESIEVRESTRVVFGDIQKESGAGNLPP